MRVGIEACGSISSEEIPLCVNCVISHKRGQGQEVPRRVFDLV